MRTASKRLPAAQPASYPDPGKIREIESDAMLRANPAAALIYGAESGDLQLSERALLEKIDHAALTEALFWWVANEPLVRSDDGSGREQKEEDAYFGKIVRQLVEKGASIEARKYGETPLMMAAEHGETAAVKILVEKGARIDARGPDGETALIRAAYGGCICGPYTEGPARLLLDHGADIEATDQRGGTALVYAGASGFSWTVKMLIERGANLEASNNDGETALLAASGAGVNDSIGAVRILLNAGASIEARNKKGETPLIKAASGQYESTKIVKLLLDHGADVDVRDNRGRTALDAAARRHDAELVALLKARSGN